MELQLAIEHHLAGRLVEAAQAYAKVLEATPDNVDAMHLLGRAMSDLGDQEAALIFLTQACQLSPTQISYKLSLALVCSKMGRLEQAQAAYAEVLSIAPDSESAWFGLGNMHQTNANAIEAEHCFARALELRENFFEARYNLANLQKTRGAVDEAVQNYRQVLAIAPDFGDAYHNLGSALQQAGRLDEALAVYAQALRFDWPETHNNIGNILLEREQYDAALASYQCALALKPDYPEAWNNAGNVHCRLAQHAAAEAAFREALRLAPDYGVAHLNLGDLQQALGNHDAAINHYERALVNTPDPAKVNFQLGIAHARKSSLDRAAQCFAAVIALQPEYPDALFNLGVTYGRQFKNEAAEAVYRQVLQADPDHVGAHINLSALLKTRGRSDEAQQHIDAAYSRCNVFVKAVPNALRSVLIIFDAGKGNINLTHLFDERNNTLIDWMIEYATEDQCSQLPPYNVVFNAMGDADVAGDTSVQMRRFLGVCAKPLLNHPDRVAQTARHRLPKLLEDVSDIFVPPLWRCVDADAWEPGPTDENLPLLVRPVHAHGGEGMALLHTPAEVAAFRGNQAEPIYVSPYVDYRSADGYFRKYRIIFVDRQPYPYHLAISPHWMVHYFSAEMESHAWKLAEEKAFLDNPASVLGMAGMQALRNIGKRLDLDYAGIDFSIMPDGRLLIFEANPTMLAHPEAPAGALAHKNVSVERIFAAFENMLERTTVA